MVWFIVFGFVLFVLFVFSFFGVLCLLLGFTFVGNEWGG